ncbi:conserved exported hypothetical protein [uncultured Stenotrophomonas sp.]|uniref:Prepilin-type N-terminal cleavage/methylation domain-containing protein n=1 Tax=uncultured Stenotrophomonas sp. TaxID=165438 RepID=A0A1Y5Q7K8_9GAMM|nr:conserved exported hypothetical protein [uncultured Stenotrophomonas sp.]
MKRATGFTLIELMVTVAIMAVLALAGMPFARSWMESNRQMQVRNLLWEGIAQSRAVALRNPGGTAAGPAARLERTGAGVLRVTCVDGIAPDGAATPCVPDPDANPERVLWKSAVLPGGGTSTLQLATAGNVISPADWTCVAFDNRGHRVTTGADCVTAAGTPRIAIGFNNQDPLYVDLL